MRIKKPDDILFSEITPKDLYLNRRRFIIGASALVAALLGYRVVTWMAPGFRRVPESHKAARATTQ